MKALSTLKILIPLLVLSFCIACSEDDPGDQDFQEINITAGQEFEFDLGLQRMFDRPDGIVEAEIISQANNFDRSEIEFEVTGLGLEDNVFYKYKPQTDFTGTDKVEIRVCRSFECDDPDSQQEIVRFLFVVSD
ncbi:MAG: hypothetical protein AAFX87_13920 [Bacteroidota bacterium]